MSDWHNTSGDRETVLRRAREYPYLLPADSYRWLNDEVHAFDPAECKGRTAVLAVGSNMSPQQLTRKYGRDETHPIPVQRCYLQDFDVVYSAHIARYGSIPAMLQHSPGTRVALFLTWLTDGQLETMHKTELGAEHYHFGRVSDVAMALDTGEVLGEFHVYVSQRGHVEQDGGAVALAAVSAENRRFPALYMADMISRLHERAAPELDGDAFILKLVEDLEYRKACMDMLGETFRPFAHPYEIVRAS